ncbi:ATP-binding response regulator [Thermostaphylospora chromogena]|uniref:histidine kinase n=1 Tax=Thermostaphylospora chromogena TaxID=35622 RepID=A0A1H1CMT6_9ACTN|nr:ATP-binding protein [Thermostaphylospora chromogena]SDQ65503.1 Signal transduction histidine kinase [Thermostaphylospora chromogena]
MSGGRHGGRNGTARELARATVCDGRDVFAVRRLGREVAELVGLEKQDRIRVASALSEIGREVLGIRAHPDARPEARAEIVFTLAFDALNITVHTGEQADLEHSEGVTLARRLVDDITIDAEHRRIVMVKRLPPGRPHLSATDIRARLARRFPVHAMDELREQNRELAATLEEVRRLNTELQETNQGVMVMYNQLNTELEETNRGVVALYAELEEKSARLREAGEARNRFWTMVSHELRTPLNSIIGLVRLLSGPGGRPLDGEQLHQVQLIGNAAETMLALVSELLDMAKAEAEGLEPEPVLVDLVTLAERLRMSLQPTGPPNGVTLETDVADEASELFVDEGMLTRILRNVLTNAVKFTPRGEIRLTARLDAAAREVVITVADTGIGIPEEHQRLVFEEFYQVPGPIQATVQGSGLGLPYALRLTRALGGTLELTSRPGEGTTVTLRVPQRIREPEVGRVLIADDDADFRAAARKILAGFAAQVDEAVDGVSALDRLIEHPPDVLLLDMLMPRLAGNALLHRMAEDPRLRDVPVVTVAGTPEQATGPHPVLIKQELRRERLLEAIHEAMRRDHAV